MDNVSLVRRIAQHLIARLPPSVLLDDLVQSGMVGLLEAAQNFETGKGASFETFAGIRIRGAMLDEMRRGDWVPRSVHQNARKISEAIQLIEARNQGMADDEAIALQLGVSLKDYHHMLADVNNSRLIELDGLLQVDDNLSDGLGDGVAKPHEQIEQQDLRKSIAAIISSLPEREQLVLALYYDEELNLKEIGDVLDVSESRVSQLHKQALIRLQSKIQ